MFHRVSIHFKVIHAILCVTRDGPSGSFLRFHFLNEARHATAVPICNKEDILKIRPTDYSRLDVNKRNAGRIFLLIMLGSLCLGAIFSLNLMQTPAHATCPTNTSPSDESKSPAGIAALVSRQLDSTFGQQVCSVKTSSAHTPAHSQTLAAVQVPAQRVQPLSYQQPQSASASLAPDAPSISNMIGQVFGPYAGAAQHVAMCESSLNPGATNSEPIGGSHAAGVFQILYPSTWSTTSQAANSPYDAYANIVAAHEIFVRDGYSWREWVCQP